MKLFDVIILFSSISFLGYGIAYFTSTKMKNEFIRFGLAKFGALTAVLEILGGLGLLVGLKFNFILVLSSGGLALLMLLGFGVRIKMKDSFLVSLPAFFYLVLNAYIFYNSLILF
jgi:hypothetical protein